MSEALDTSAPTTGRSSIVANGVDGVRGTYLLEPMTPTVLLERVEGDSAPRATERRPISGVDPRDLASAGWGAVFPADLAPDEDRRLREALAPLLELRRAQAGRRFQLFAGPTGYRPGQSASDFMAQSGIGPGPVDPDEMPYYLLLVGDADTIPYPVQHDLDLALAVGRICFDTPEELRRYAESVVAAEAGNLARPRRAAFLAPSHDPATEMSCRGLVEPLARRIGEHLAGERRSGGEAGRGWTTEALLAEDADRDAFESVLGRRAPAFAFTASHGVGFPADHPRQAALQGALLSQGWPGPGAGSLCREHYFAAEDVPGDGALGGLVSFHFACYGAGTPHRDRFAHRKDGPVRNLAPRPLVARLPRRLLSHPNGGALAAIGHVDRAWGWSFVWGASYQLEVFDSAVREILDGYPVGAAMEHFGQRHGQIAAMLAGLWTRRRQGESVDEERLAGLWTAANDAGAYVILGDPAVRLAPEPAPRSPDR